MPGPADRGEVRRSRRAGRLSASSSTAAPYPTCLYCRERISGDEPVVVVEHEGDRQTSLAREPELAGQPGALLLHVRCAPAGWSGGG